MNLEKNFKTRNELLLLYLIVVVLTTTIYFLVPQNLAFDRLINGGYLCSIMIFGLYIRYKMNKI